MSVKEEMRVASFRAQGLEVSSPGSPDAVTGLVAIALQCGGLAISRVSKDRKPLLFYLSAVPIPIVLGAIATWKAYRELGRISDLLRLEAPEYLSQMYSEAWTHTYFGCAASALLLLLIMWGLAWKRPVT